VFGALSVMPIQRAFPASPVLAGSSANIDTSELVFASARDAAWAIRQKAVSSVELTQLLLNRIDRHNPALNAIVTLLPEEAMK